MRYIALTTAPAPFSGMLEAVALNETETGTLLDNLAGNVPSTMSEDQWNNMPADDVFKVGERRVLFVYVPARVEPTEAEWGTLAEYIGVTGVTAADLTSAVTALKALRSDAGPSKWGVNIPPNIRVNTAEVPSGSLAVATREDGMRLMFLNTGPTTPMYVAGVNADDAVVAGYNLARNADIRMVAKWLSGAVTFASFSGVHAHLDQTLMGPFATGRLFVPDDPKSVELDDDQYVTGLTTDNARAVAGDRPAFIVTKPTRDVVMQNSITTEVVCANDLAALAAASRGGSYVPGVEPTHARVPDSVLMFTLQDIFDP